jgi:transcriptional regulator with XRE-family HTH domain
VDALQRRLEQRIRDLAEAKGIALSHLPDRAELGRTMFWDVLRGKKSPTLRWMGKLAAALEVDVSELLAVDPRPPSRPKR